VLRQVGQVVELAPVQDPLAVGLRALDDAGVRAGGDEDDVGLDLLVPLPSTVTSTWPGPLRQAAPCSTFTPSRPRRAVMSADCASASAFTRACTSVTSAVTEPSVRTPICSASSRWTITSLVAMKVLDGTQSDSTHWPPTPSRSTRTTSASSCVATRAAS
jgi:hypothetical protein